MNALLKVELTRLRWRRAVVALVTACVLVPAVIFAATAWNTRPISAAERQQVQQEVEAQANEPFIQRQVRHCVARPQRYGVPAGADVQASCKEIFVPTAEGYFGRPALRLDAERSGSGVGVAIVLTVLLLILGTTFVGHDWNSGSMSNQLLFDPRRARVWAAKGAVVLLAGLVVAGLVLTAYWTGLWALAQHRGLDVRDGALHDGYRQALRATLLAGFAGLGGYALTMLFRSTVATLGILFAVAIAGPLLITLLGFPGHERLMPQNNYAAVVLGGMDYYEGPVNCLGGSCSSVRRHLDAVDGATYFGALLVAVAVPSVLSFRRRDVP